MIKNIIFDLGGVLLDIDFNLSNQAFSKLGVSDFKQYVSQHYADDLFERFETGAISVPDFYDEFRKKTKLELSNTDIENAWNSMLLHFSKERMERLEELGKRFNIYLFSNTNEIHVKYFTELCREEIGKELSSYFIKTWYSNEVGFRKPYVASFKRLLSLENLSPDETLFIDDTVGNIEGAELADLKTIHLSPPKTLMDLKL
ncbi:MAG: HAD family phosphatase [Arachidicoccus sp.]|nr:HAD family phosphatase [Arachidicoccus sp.]